MAQPTSLHVPHLCAIEVASALRGLVSGKKLDATRAEAALSDLADLPATRHPAEPFLPRIWELRRNLTTYDAAYVTLAEALDATLITADRKLAPKYGHHARVPGRGGRWLNNDYRFTAHSCGTRGAARPTR